MSDDEMKLPEGADDGSDDDIEAGMGGFDQKSALPEGITKEIITAASSSNWKTPKVGDEVKVHYVGTLQSDGSEFDSSRGRGDPFTFTLGKGHVIKGWDLGVATMKKGEVSKFTLAPEFAYGDSGSPPKIPGKATLIFEIELLDWDSKDDLFSDGGVVKTQLKEGSGWKEPKDGDEVQIRMKVTRKDDNSTDDKGSFEYTVGSGLLGSLTKAVDKALKGMKKGELVSLECSQDYAFQEEKPSGASIELLLEEMFETKDCSIAKDRSLIKKRVREGEGYDTPKECAAIRLKVEAATDGSKALPGFQPTTLEFIAGNGEVCDALEYVVIEMKQGEQVTLTCTKPDLCKEEKIGLATISAEKVVLKLTLESFEKGKDTWNMSEEEKVEFGTARKEVGSNLFKAGRIGLALERYKKVIDMFSYTDNFKEENKKKTKDLKKACELNKAACQLKLQDFDSARTSCNSILKDDPENAKALFRRAQAELALKNYDECIKDAKRILLTDSQNREVRALLKDALAGQKEEDKKSQGMFGKMCQALGKGPIPEPYKDRRFDFDKETSLPEEVADAKDE